uniref:tumor protein p53-inducible protein 11 n=1 Tax=Ciona intestinalis TaxID=7719 RepID=UPI000180BE69|nr:tumor protein p53-inducible protein 11 [Ciona intestinalis]|eukprot:XP_002130208.1 tumor protein p53-inducible protein 11 [Ciona intestinalis]
MYLYRREAFIQKDFYTIGLIMANVLHSIQSRLKSRKVLGVGEGADGKIPRSKISQLLGCNHLEPWSLQSEDYPVGLRLFQWIMCLAFLLVGSMNLFFPDNFYGVFACSLAPHESTATVSHLASNIRTSYMDLMTSSDELRHDAEKLEKQLQRLEDSTRLSILPVRMYGAAVFTLALLFLVTTLRDIHDRRSVRLTLFLQALFLTVEVIVSVTSGLHLFSGTARSKVVWATLSRGVAGGIAFFYYGRTSGRPRENGQKWQD